MAVLFLHRAKRSDWKRSCNRIKLIPPALPGGTSTAANASAYKVTGGDWASGTITWDNKPAASTALATNISHNNLTGYTFSCKTAVQAWYNGSTTGSNANYGIMLRYYNESVADYNAVYSADCTTESKRPALTITYTPPSSSISVLEGKTYTLTPPSVSGTITWSSSNTSVATVNSSGKVTGVKAGKVTISASVSGTVQKTYTVYVRIPNGVYYLKNVSAGLYLGTSGLIADNTLTQVQSKSTSGISKIRQLWKITYLNNGYYSVRQLYKLDMAVGLSGSNVVVRQTVTTDSLSTVPSGFWWTISYDTSGYVLKYYGSNGVVMRVADGASSPGLGVVVGAYTSTSTKHQWTMERQSSPPSGAYLYDTSTDGLVTSPTRYIVAGESKTLADFNLLAASYFYNPYSNNQSFTWSVSGNNSCVTVNSSTGEVSGISVGTATIIGTGYAGTVQYSVQVLPIADGTYFIRNKHSDKYADIQNTTMQSGTAIVHWDLEGDSSQKWIFTHLGGGTYSIKSANSSTAYYLGVSGDSSANEQPAVLRTGSLKDGMKWKISTTTSGAYTFTPLTGLSSNRVLALEIDAYGVQNGDILYQRDYVADANYEDEWYLCRQKDYTLMYLGEHADDPSMPSILESVEDALINNAQMSGHANTSMTSVEVLEHLASSRVFSCITHGKQTLIKTSDGEFTINDINSLPNSAFNNLELVCVTACLAGSGRDDETNFVNTLYNKGADTVIGFTISINVDAADYWTEQFMLSLAQGKTVADAMTAADAALRDNDDITDVQKKTVASDTRYVLGPTTIAPCD